MDLVKIAHLLAAVAPARVDFPHAPSISRPTGLFHLWTPRSRQGKLQDRCCA
jgi:hypothetical protein